MTAIQATTFTRIYIAPLPPYRCRSERRRAETAAVASLVAEVFGRQAVYTHAADGAPLVSGLRDCSISVSHGAGRVVLAVSSLSTVGVDIESPRPELTHIAGKFLSAREIATYQSPEALLLAWTAKEAAFKAARIHGLTIAGIILSHSGAITPAGCFKISHIPLSDSAVIAIAEP